MDVLEAAILACHEANQGQLQATEEATVLAVEVERLRNENETLNRALNMKEEQLQERREAVTTARRAYLDGMDRLDIAGDIFVCFKGCTVNGSLMHHT